MSNTILTVLLVFVFSCFIRVMIELVGVSWQGALSAVAGLLFYIQLRMDQERRR